MKNEIILRSVEEKFLKSKNFVFNLPEEYKDLRSEAVFEAIKIFSMYSTLESGSIFKKGQALYSIQQDKEIKDWIDFSKKAFGISKASIYSYLSYYSDFKDRPEKIISFSSWRTKRSKDSLKNLIASDSGPKKKREMRKLINSLKRKLDGKEKEINILKKQVDSKVINTVKQNLITAEDIVDDLKEDLNESLTKLKEDDGEEYSSYMDKLIELVEKSWTLKKQAQGVNSKLGEFGTNPEIKQLSTSISLKIDELHKRMFKKK